MSFSEEYVSRLKNGDPRTAEHFSKHFGVLIYLKLRGKIRSPQLAEDIRQETLLRVLSYIRSGKQLDHPERLGAFVHSVCNNVMLELLRSDTRHSQMPEDGPEPVDSTVNYHHDLVSAERKRLVAQVLTDLPTKDRELLRQAFLEERDKAEICQEFGVDGDYLRVLLHRAKNRFRSALAKRGTSAGEW